ncbi:hypothetical protein ACIP5Y_37525 [Nocardia sp. NPDC088792]|uniref:hypothetical protein n=1 Tax=Nocardia sp. NPDC088792 TaxID=3364332 RepID=UPI00380BAFC2
MSLVRNVARPAAVTADLAADRRGRSCQPASNLGVAESLFTQQPLGTGIWIALAWCIGILIVAYVFAMITYRRKIS